MADVGVRAARRRDVDAVTDIQIRAWRHFTFLPEGPLEQMAGEGARELWRRQWEEAIVAPPTPRHRLLVAVEREPADEPNGNGDAVPTRWRERVVGLASHSPAEDPDLDPTKYAELLTLLVDPDHVRRGHGSRLLNATVDHLREDGFAAVVTWVFAEHLPMLAFLESAGWAADEAERVLDMGRPVRMIRLATDIS
jgi:GNAT superfamily N-acetyltransferase